VVIAIIGILASIILGFLTDARTKAENSAILSEVHEQQNTLALYQTDNNGYPPIPNGGNSWFACLTNNCELAGQTLVSLVSLAGQNTALAASNAPSGSSLTADAILSKYSTGATSLTTAISISGEPYLGLIYFCDASSGAICTGLSRIYYAVHGTGGDVCGIGTRQGDDTVNTLCYQSAGQSGTVSGSIGNHIYTFDGPTYPYYSTTYLNGFSQGTGWYNNGGTGYYGRTMSTTPYPYAAQYGGQGSCVDVVLYYGNTSESYCNTQGSSNDNSSNN